MTQRDDLSHALTSPVPSCCRHIMNRILCIGMLALCTSCGKDDMAHQPSWKSQQMEVLLPDGSLPVAGREEAVESTEAYSRLTNPIAPSEASADHGKALFQKHCVPCHGAEAKGGGVMAKYFGEPPPLGDPGNQQLSDGFFYSAMRHGRGMMPALGEALSTEERWHVVNYLRRLQKQ